MIFFFHLILALLAFLFSRAELLFSNLVKCHMRNTSVKYFEIRPLAAEEMSFKGFSIFSSGSHFVQPTGTILAISEEGHWRNTSVQIF